MSEEKPKYITEAEEMLGSGYESVRIEPERSVIRRINGKMESYDLPAFVKISTSFKSELAEISGDALKVWHFIALSINRNTGKANPGLRTIAENVKLAVNTVQKCLQELENLNLLTVDRQSRKYNIYETPEYVSANKAEPTVSNRDTDAETVSNSKETVSNFSETVSPSVILNQKNQSNQNKPKGDLVDLELAKLAKTQGQNEALTTFERDLQLPASWTWYPAKSSEEKEWATLREFVEKTYKNDPAAFSKYQTWRTQPYARGAMSNRAIKNSPADFPLSFSDFLASSAMYGGKHEVKQEAPRKEFPTLVDGRIVR